MEYEAKKYDHLMGLEGFGDELLKNHFALYEGYVANANKAAGLIAAADPATPEYAELKRRFGWEFDGMRLHELYFGNLKKDGGDPEPGSELGKALAGSFGSLEQWEKDFAATGAMRGIGWVIAYLDRESGRIFNAWINEHDGGHLAECVPLVVMDVFEHAYMIEYGLKKADYLQAFLKAIDWETVAERFAR